MADYYAILARKLQETADDPGKMREVVYEAARLALRWQVQEKWPHLSIIQSRRHISELEDAIARLEADAAGVVGPSKIEPSEAVGGLKTSQQDCTLSNESARDDVPRNVEEFLSAPQELPSAELVGLEAVAGSLRGRDNAEPVKAAANAAVQFDDDGAPNLVAEFCLGPRVPPLAEPAVQEPVAGSLEDRGICELAATGLEATRQSRKENIASDTLRNPHSQFGDQHGAEPTGVEADDPGLGGRDKHGPSRAAKGLQATRQGLRAPVESNEDDIPDKPRNPRQAEPADGEGDGYREPGNAGAGFRASRRSRYAPIEPEQDDTSCQPGGPSQAELSAQAKSANRLGHGYREPGKAGAAFRASRQSRYAPVDPEWDDACDTVRGQIDLVGSQKFLVPDRARRPAYLVNPADFVSPEVTYQISPAPRSPARMAVFGLMIASQLTIAALSVAAFYIAVSGRNSPVQTAKEMLPAAEQTSSAYPMASPYGRVADAAATLAAAPAVSAMSFPRPTTYGVYAISSDQLIELEQVQGTPVDPRIRSQLQINKPARTVIGAAKPVFVVFRRDLVSSAPDKIPVRIASRIAHSMVFDAAGKPVVTTPATDTWLIRDRGFDLRVSPMRESPEMVMLRPEDPEFSFSSGRYELMLGGQTYDFVVAGEVTDPAHCVEGVATVRGPVFYECKTAR